MISLWRHLRLNNDSRYYCRIVNFTTHVFSSNKNPKKKRRENCLLSFGWRLCYSTSTKKTHFCNSRLQINVQQIICHPRINCKFSLSYCQGGTVKDSRAKLFSIGFNQMTDTVFNESQRYGCSFIFTL